jgi:pimeloyl-ACP methyl ester carboxylesterase
MEQAVSYHSIEIDGVSIFYREAGTKGAPAILLLHGLPSSSRMYESLLRRLGNQFHLIAPDYPGFGHSDWPNPKEFEYTFDRLAAVMGNFVNALGIGQYSLYMQDYGGPVGFRLALAHPEQIRSLIIQNAVSHDQGLGPSWAVRRQFWADRAANEADLKKNLLSFETTRGRHLGNDPATELYDPDLWTDEFAFLSQPGQRDIQTELFYDYRTNVASYPQWQTWMQKTQPRLLVIWGRYDPSFDISEPEAYRRDVPNASIHVLEAGHFALDTKAHEIAGVIRSFEP